MKKILSLLLIGTLFLSLVACGNGSSSALNSSKNKKTEFITCQSCGKEKQCYNVIIVVDGEVQDGGTVCEDCLKSAINSNSAGNITEVIYMNSYEELEKLDSGSDNRSIDEILSELRKTKVVEKY